MTGTKLTPISNKQNKRGVLIDGPVAVTALNDGRLAYVDTVDAKLLARASWSNDGDGYARRGHREGAYRRSVRLHEDVIHNAGIRVPGGHVIDHIDGNRLNNRRSNLRVIPIHRNASIRAARLRLRAAA